MTLQNVVDSRKPSEDEVSDSDAHAGISLQRRVLTVVKRVFSNTSEPGRSPMKSGGNTLPRVKGRPLQGGRKARNVTRGASASNKRGKK